MDVEAGIVLKKIDDFFKKYSRFQYKKRETIIFAGDVPAGVFYIVSGYVRSFIYSKSGKEFTARIYKPGDLFSLRATLTNQPTTHSYETLTEVELIRAPKEDFINFLTPNNEILLYMTKIFLGRLNNTVKRLETTLLGDAHEKVSIALIFLAEGLGSTDIDTITLNVPITHQEIATITGLTRETVTLEIDRLKTEGIITQDERVFKITNIKKLKEKANLFD